MKEQLLKVIDELELLRAMATVDGRVPETTTIEQAITDLQWMYKRITQYE